MKRGRLAPADPHNTLQIQGHGGRLPKTWDSRSILGIVASCHFDSGIWHAISRGEWLSSALMAIQNPPVPVVAAPLDESGLNPIHTGKV